MAGLVRARQRALLPASDCCCNSEVLTVRGGDTICWQSAEAQRIGKGTLLLCLKGSHSLQSFSVGANMSSYSLWVLHIFDSITY